MLEERRNFSRRERKITENSRLKKGFTLAELLIVVSIIAVLVAIGIPIFTSQLEKSREAVDLSEVRSAYAEVMMAALTGDTNATYTKDGSKIYLSSGDYQITVQPLKQKQDGWQTKTPLNIGGVSSEAGQPYWIGVPAANGYCKITYHVADDYVSFEWSGGTENGGSNNISPDNGKGDTDNKGDSSQKPEKDDNDFTAIINKYGNGEWPEDNTNAPRVSYKAGEITRYQGIYYVAIGECNEWFNQWYNTPSQTGRFITFTGNVYTPQNLDDKKNLSNIHGGDVYITEDGDMYVSKSFAATQDVPPTSSADIWVKVIKKTT